jgi:hypothetical protein
MSSWYRDPELGPLTALRIAVLSATGMLPTGASVAADAYVVPVVELRVEHNDNYGLVVGGNPDSSILGYIADAQALIGIDTPRSKTSIRPRLKFQEYPDVDDFGSSRKVTPVEGFLDLITQYEWQRSDFRLIGRYSRQDSYNVETPSGVFDPLDPSYGNDPDSSRTRVGETRDRFQLQPTFSYEVTERTRVGVSADYQMVRYDSEGVQSKLDYDYAFLDGFVTWSLNPVSDITVGAYASNYQAMSDVLGDISETDAYGGRVGYAYRWSNLSGIEAGLFYERDDITDQVLGGPEQSTSGWGGDVMAYWKQEVSEWRVTVGRYIRPTSDGRKAEVGDLRLQYDRDLSEKLSFQGAARYETRDSIAPTLLSDDRDYARIDVALEWFMTPTWYVSGGYSYLWQDRDRAPQDADNNRIFLAVGYKGLNPRR